MIERTHHPLIYLAGPLFTQAEWRWNQELTAHLRSLSFEVILPQERAAPMLSGVEPFDAKTLFTENVKDIERSDVVVAILDGSDADSGTCWECGYAYKSGRPIVGVRTDLRAAGDDPQVAMNLMLALSCSEVVLLPQATRTDISWLAEQIDHAVRNALKRRR